MVAKNGTVLIVLVVYSTLSSQCIGTELKTITYTRDTSSIHGPSHGRSPKLVWFASWVLPDSPHGGGWPVDASRTKN